MINDPIADFLIQLKNGNRAGRESVTLPASNLKLATAEALVKAGYLKSVVRRGKKVKKFLTCELAYQDGAPKITKTKRLSRPSCRVYYKTGDIKSVRQGFGTLFLSTPKGVMTGKEARDAKLGGEALFEIF
ncbi:MAG: 30S ribosomal protein S8 [Candidatus Paceibacterota bacterium]|jgi:small subunit ribosomal protein S8